MLLLLLSEVDTIQCYDKFVGVLDNPPRFSTPFLESQIEDNKEFLAGGDWLVDLDLWLDL